MASLEINTELFDGLSLYQRINAMLELQAQINSATEKRMDRINDVHGDEQNGSLVAFYMAEDALKKIQRHLIDSTVEKFGGVG